MTRGFSLIETVIYLALFAILIGGVVVAAANLFEASTRGQTVAMLLDEGNFLVSKVDWALYGARAVTAPASGTSCTSACALTISKWDTSVGNPITITETSGNLTLKRGSASAAILNNTNVTVSNFSVAHVAGSGDGVNPEGVTVSFTLSARTPNGMVVSRDFTTTNYVRK